MGRVGVGGEMGEGTVGGRVLGRMWYVEGVYMGPLQ